MSRTARLQAESGIYHIMLRGINRQQIFEDTEDYALFQQILRHYKHKCGYELLAYCMMGNHVHLLIKEGSEPLGQVFKRIGASFVYWYNAKYQRVGHLFQDRFKSEAVEDEAYLCTVINYIHQNPVKAGICKYPEEYPYSSFREYLGQAELIDMDCVERYIARKTVVDQSRRPVAEDCLEMNDAPILRVTDQQASRIMKTITECDSVTAFQALEPLERNKHIRTLKRHGLSLRQISRLTGVSYYVVQYHRKVPSVERKKIEH